MLNHFLELKVDNDALKSRVATRKGRREAELKERFPISADRGQEVQTFAAVDDIEAEAEKMAERRGFSEDLIWLQDKVIEYLCSDICPTSRQTEEGVAELANGLQDHGLVKAEVLQICNLAPVEPVELYGVSAPSVSLGILACQI